MRKVTGFIILLGMLFLVSCGSGGSGVSDTPGLIVGASLTLSSSLLPDDTVPKQGEVSVFADVTDAEGNPAVDGSPVYFAASVGTISSQASTLSGRATATYLAPTAGGSVTINAGTESVDGTLQGLVDEYSLTVESGPAAQIALVSITPSQLGLRGSGENEIGIFVFNVTDGVGGPVEDGQVVYFALEAPTGGAEFVSDPSATTIAGRVMVSVISGSVAGVATVTASTESDLGTIAMEARITMGNSQPDQLHLGFAAERLNVPGLIRFGIENNITAYVADRYSNPVPAGTPVYFAGECGIVALTDADGIATNTTNSFGQATATAITAAPTDELCKYIYWTEGQEAYTDSNGNGMYDMGEPHQDIGEPYIDANDSDSYDADETYFDLDGNGIYTGVDGIWQGNTFVWTDANIRWSANVADPVVTPDTFSITQGSSQTFEFTAADINDNPDIDGTNIGNSLPSGTTIEVTTDCDNVTLSGDTEVTLPDAVNNQIKFFVNAVAADDSEPGSCSVTFEVAGLDDDGNGSGSTTISGEIVAGAL